MLLEVTAQVHQRLPQQRPVLHECGDQQSPDASVAIQEGVDGFELGVDQRDPDQRRQVGVGGMDEALQVRQQTGHLLRRWRHEGGIARSRAANPVLRATQFAGQLAGTSRPIEQPPMGLAQQANAERQAMRVAQLPLHPAEGALIVGDLLDIVGVADLQTGFLVKQVGQRGLGALDLRGEQCLLADGAVKQPFHRRDQARHPG